MKSFFSSVIVVVSFAINAVGQVDTLSEYYTGTQNVFYALVDTGNGQIIGYTSGTDPYGNIEKGNRFNYQNGLSGYNALKGVLLNIEGVVDNGGIFKINVYSVNNLGLPQGLLYTQNKNLNEIDTAPSAYILLGPNQAEYNTSILFDSTVFIPNNNDIAVMVELPQTAGDTLLIATNVNGDYALSPTHSLFRKGNGTFGNFYQEWGLSVAMSIFPIVDIVNTASTSFIDSDDVIIPSVITSDIIEVGITGTNGIKNVDMFNLSGSRTKASIVNGNQIEVSDLSEGVYFLSIELIDGTLVTKRIYKMIN